jgi:Uma2 family endonuclease
VTAAAITMKSFDALYEEIRALPEGQRGEILTPGEVFVTMGRPGRRHRWATQSLYANLLERDAKVGGTGWWIEIEPEVRFGERMFDPDLAGWRVERVAQLPETLILDRPDWVCEVLSPSTAARDRSIKLPRYIAHGVPWVWLIDPAGQIVEVFSPRDGLPTVVMTASDEESIVLPPFDLALDVRRLWGTEAKPSET